MVPHRCPRQIGKPHFSRCTPSPRCLDHPESFPFPDDGHPPQARCSASCRGARLWRAPRRTRPSLRPDDQKHAVGPLGVFFHSRRCDQVALVQHRDVFKAAVETQTSVKTRRQSLSEAGQVTSSIHRTWPFPPSHRSISQPLRELSDLLGDRPSAPDRRKASPSESHRPASSTCHLQR